jgi:hypothetical protein
VNHTSLSLCDRKQSTPFKNASPRPRPLPSSQLRSTRLTTLLLQTTRLPGHKATLQAPAPNYSHKEQEHTFVANQRIKSECSLQRVMMETPADIYAQNHNALLLQRSRPLHRHRHDVHQSPGRPDCLRYLSGWVLYSRCRMLWCSWYCIRHCSRGDRTACCGVVQRRFRYLLYFLRRRVPGAGTVRLGSSNKWDWTSDVVLEGEGQGNALGLIQSVSNHRVATELKR